LEISAFNFFSSSVSSPLNSTLQKQRDTFHI
jgi:hypothetical protein